MTATSDRAPAASSSLARAKTMLLFSIGLPVLHRLAVAEEKSLVRSEFGIKRQVEKANLPLGGHRGTPVSGAEIAPFASTITIAPKVFSVMSIFAIGQKGQTPGALS